MVLARNNEREKYIVSNDEQCFTPVRVFSCRAGCLPMLSMMPRSR
jgi:hypothetical protein